MNSETFCKTHNARTAKFGCQNSRAPMCSECRKEHSKSKTLNEHQILTIAEYLQLENFALSINNKCLEHDQILEFYCNGHQVACCTMCTNTVHQNCSNIDLHVYMDKPFLTSLGLLFLLGIIQVWFKLAKWFQRRRLKCKSLWTAKMEAKWWQYHTWMTLWVRWAKTN